MREIPTEVLINKIGSVYKLVIIAAKRAIELGAGAARLVNMPADTKLTTIALQEILEGKISMKIKDKKEDK